MSELLSKLGAFLGAYTSWSRWVGTIIIADILFIWTKLCIDKKELVALDLTTSSILIVVYIVNALKVPPVQPPPPEI
jgi:hypothetical protein